MTNRLTKDVGDCAAEELRFWDMVAVAEPDLKSEAREIWREAHALHRIFSRIWRNTKM